MPHKIVREYFDFSRRERRGIAAMLLIIVLLYGLPSGWAYLSDNKPVHDTAGFHQAALAVAALMLKDSAAGYAAGRPPRRPGNRYEPRRPFGGKDSFRPRSTRFFPGRRDSGTVFTPRRFERKPVEPVDVNTADSAQWEALPGIGPVLARRIVGFRERLGGFHYIGQVGETYGLADSVFNKIQGMLRMGAVSLRKIDLNQTDEKSLADHPYINTKLARLIIRYRSNHGPFRQVGDLRGIALVNDSIYRKLEKYLVVK